MGEASKVCERCGSEFFRTGKVSNKQWESRRFCSKSCASKKHDHYEVGDMINRYLSGESSSDIADDLGISAVHVRRVLKGASVTLRSASEGKKLALSRADVREKMSRAATGRKLSEKAKARLRERVGPLNHNWMAGLTLSSSGYLQFTNSQENGVNAGRLLHQVIAEWKYERRTGQGEHVHHIDGNKLNNDPNNLIILSACAWLMT